MTFSIEIRGPLMLDDYAVLPNYGICNTMTLLLVRTRHYIFSKEHIYEYQVPNEELDLGLTSE